MIFLKYLCLFIAIIYGFGNVVRACRQQPPIYWPQLTFMALGVVGYLLLEFDLGF